MAALFGSVDDGSSWVNPDGGSAPAPYVYTPPPAVALPGVSLLNVWTSPDGQAAPTINFGSLVPDAGGSFLGALGATAPASVWQSPDAGGPITNPVALQQLRDAGVDIRESTFAEAGRGNAPWLVVQGYQDGRPIGNAATFEQDDDPGSLFGLAIAAAATFGVASVYTAGAAAASSVAAVDAAPAGGSWLGDAAGGLFGGGEAGAGVAAGGSGGGLFGGAAAAAGAAAIDAAPGAIAAGGAAAAAGGGLLPILGQLGSLLGSAAGIASSIGLGGPPGAQTAATQAAVAQQAAARSQLLLLLAAGAAAVLLLRK